MKNLLNLDDYRLEEIVCPRLELNNFEKYSALIGAASGVIIPAILAWEVGNYLGSMHSNGLGIATGLTAAVASTFLSHVPSVVIGSYSLKSAIILTGAYQGLREGTKSRLEKLMQK